VHRSQPTSTTKTHMELEAVDGFMTCFIDRLLADLEDAIDLNHDAKRKRCDADCRSCVPALGPKHLRTNFQGLWSGIYSFESRKSGPKAQGSGFRVQGSGFSALIGEVRWSPLMNLNSFRGMFLGLARAKADTSPRPSGPRRHLCTLRGR
jgi:hypothetical protein